jgi:hypothetical protein
VALCNIRVSNLDRVVAYRVAERGARDGGSPQGGPLPDRKGEMDPSAEL